MKNTAVEKIIVLVLLGLFVFLGVTSMLNKAPTCDEASHHIASGYVYLTKGDLRFSTEVPPLSRYIVALPLLALDMELPEDSGFWRREDRGAFSREFLYKLNNNSSQVVFLSRMMILSVALFGGVFLFLWTKRRLSAEVAIMSLFFYCLSPNVIAHAGLATTDMTATVFSMCAVLTFWDLLRSPRARTIIFAGIFLAAALLSKFSTLLLVPLFLFLCLGMPIIIPGERRKVNLWPLLGVMGIAVFIVWAGYGFEMKPILEDTLRAGEKVAFAKKVFSVFGADLQGKGIAALERVPMPLSSYLLGILGIIKHGSEGSRVFFAGKWSDSGNPLYYILAMGIKTPLPIIILFFGGIVAAIKGKYKALVRYLMLIIIAFIAAASFSDLQLGLRYILPIYPLIFIVTSIGIKEMVPRLRASKIIAGGLMVWYLVGSILVWPHYLSYFNEIIGGPDKGYKYLRDSNIDWGQDLPALKRYMDDNNIESISMSYFGSASPAYYGIKYDDITSEERISPGNKVYAVSAQYLEGVEWAGGIAPSAKAGYSIFIYDFRKER
ncbi:ArnT family glycosyltransferase [Candidatus Omnitrophota bacterium]